MSGGSDGAFVVRGPVPNDPERMRTILLAAAGRQIRFEGLFTAGQLEALGAWARAEREAREGAERERSRLKPIELELVVPTTGVRVKVMSRDEAFRCPVCDGELGLRRLGIDMAATVQVRTDLGDGTRVLIKDEEEAEGPQSVEMGCEGGYVNGEWKKPCGFSAAFIEDEYVGWEWD